MVPLEDSKLPLPSMSSMYMELVTLLANTSPVTCGISILPETVRTDIVSQEMLDVVIGPDSLFNVMFLMSREGLMLIDPVVVVMESCPENRAGRYTST